MTFALSHYIGDSDSNSNFPHLSTVFFSVQPPSKIFHLLYLCMWFFSWSVLIVFLLSLFCFILLISWVSKEHFKFYFFCLIWAKDSNKDRLLNTWFLIGPNLLTSHIKIIKGNIASLPCKNNKIDVKHSALLMFCKDSYGNP